MSSTTLLPVLTTTTTKITTEFRIPIQEQEELVNASNRCCSPLDYFCCGPQPPDRSMVSITQPIELRDILSDDEYHRFCTTIFLFIPVYDDLLIGRKRDIYMVPLLSLWCVLASLTTIIFYAYDDIHSLFPSNPWLLLWTMIKIVFCLVLAVILLGKLRTSYQESCGAVQMQIYNILLLKCSEISKHCCDVASFQSTSPSVVSYYTFAILSTVQHDLFGEFHYLDAISITIETYTDSSHTQPCTDKQSLTTTTSDDGVTTTTSTIVTTVCCTDNVTARTMVNNRLRRLEPTEQVQHDDENITGSIYTELV